MCKLALECHILAFDLTACLGLAEPNDHYLALHVGSLSKKDKHTNRSLLMQMPHTKLYICQDEKQVIACQLLYHTNSYGELRSGMLEIQLIVAPNTWYVQSERHVSTLIDELALCHCRLRE